MFFNVGGGGKKGGGKGNQRVHAHCAGEGLFARREGENGQKRKELAEGGGGRNFSLNRNAGERKNCRGAHRERGAGKEEKQLKSLEEGEKALLSFSERGGRGNAKGGKESASLY